jgi:DNA gyrase subunit B
MYIGSCDERGILVMVSALLENSLAEFAGGYGHRLKVTLGDDGTIEIDDDGRGLSVNPDSLFGNLGLTTFTTISMSNLVEHECRDPFEYMVANALSERLRLVAHHEGRVWRQEFCRGVPTEPPNSYNIANTQSGLTVVFKPDPSIFSNPHVSSDTLRERLREYAYLNSGVSITLTDQTNGGDARYQFEDGIRELVRRINADVASLHPDVIVARGEEDGVSYQVGLQWRQDSLDTETSFVNDRPTPNGGTHVAGVRDAVTQTLNDIISAGGRPDARSLRGDAVREGLTAVVSVRVREPRFEGAMRNRFNNPEARTVLARAIGRSLRSYFDSNPTVLAAVIRKAQQAEQEYAEHVANKRRLRSERGS